MVQIKTSKTFELIRIHLSRVLRMLGTYRGQAEIQILIAIFGFRFRMKDVHK